MRSITNAATKTRRQRLPAVRIPLTAARSTMRCCAAAAYSAPSTTPPPSHPLRSATTRRSGGGRDRAGHGHAAGRESGSMNRRGQDNAQTPARASREQPAKAAQQTLRCRAQNCTPNTHPTHGMHINQIVYSIACKAQKPKPLAGSWPPGRAARLCSARGCLLQQPPAVCRLPPAAPAPARLHLPHPPHHASLSAAAPARGPHQRPAHKNERSARARALRPAMRSAQPAALAAGPPPSTLPARAARHPAHKAPWQQQQLRSRRPG